MKIVAWLSSKLHEQELGRALFKSAIANGDECEWRPVGSWAEGTDLGECGMVIGIHTSRQPLAEYYREAGVPYVHLDKGFTRTAGDIKTEFWRWSVSGHQPTRYLPRLMRGSIGDNDNRRLFLGWTPSDRHDAPGGPVIYCAPSGRTLGWYGCQKPDEDPKVMEQRIWREDVKRIRKAYGGNVPIFFRPKPARVKELRDWQVPDDVTLDAAKVPLATRMKGARLLATWASVAGIEAILAGIPVVALNETAARPLAATSYEQSLPFPDRETQRRWLNALAWCQFNWSEWPEPFAWRFVRRFVQLDLRGEL